jgi:hypothetical protein
LINLVILTKFLGRTGTGGLFLCEAETGPKLFLIGKNNFAGPDPAPPHCFWLY